MGGFLLQKIIAPRPLCAKINQQKGRKMSKILELLKNGNLSGNVLKQTGEDIFSLEKKGLIKISATYPRITIYEITQKGLDTLKAIEVAND